MIKFENVEVVGWEHAIRGMRNPKNSWDRSDTIKSLFNSEFGYIRDQPKITVGPKDRDLMQCLASAGPVHAKYRRMIVVYVDITAPLYWWKEFDTYKVGTVSNSCSTMHKIHEKEFTLNDFSFDQLLTRADTLPVENMTLGCSPFNDAGELVYSPINMAVLIVSMLNKYRKLFLDTNDKKYWWQMIQLLPSSYNQKRTIMMSYEVLANINNWRTNHKIDEWVAFCEWSHTLPYAGIFSVQKQEEDL